MPALEKPDTPAPVAALRYARDILQMHRSSEGRISVGIIEGDRLMQVLHRAIRHHWNGACFDVADCDCGRCTMCGEPVANQRTPADRYDEEYPDSCQGPYECTGCGLETAHGPAMLLVTG